VSDARIDGYARALFEIARAEGTIDEVEDELFRFARSYESSDELRSALTDDQVPVAKRQAIVEDLLGGKATPTTTQLVSMVVGSGRGRDLPAIIDKLVARAANSKNLSVAEERSRPHRRPARPTEGGARQCHRQAGERQGDHRSVHPGRDRGHRGRHRHRRQRSYARRTTEEPSVEPARSTRKQTNG
jgi:F-type H+-transporting ATPase subunit delta